MKSLFRVVSVLLLLLSAGFAQTQLTATSTGKQIRANAAQETLALSDTVIYVSVNGNGTSGTNLGTLSFTTPDIATGDLQTGATFNAGGTFTVNAPGYIDYTGNFTQATWVESTLANGSVYYTLSGSLSSTEGSGAFVCLTETLPIGQTFSGSAKIKQCNFSAPPLNS